MTMERLRERTTVPRLLIATNNPGKLAEYGVLLEGCGWELVGPARLGLHLSVDETGPDYATNARIKAEAFARAGGLVTLADDSGLEVDALGGRPGPLSARYAGPDQTDEEGVRLLLTADEGRPGGASTGALPLRDRYRRARRPRPACRGRMPGPDNA